MCPALLRIGESWGMLLNLRGGRPWGAPGEICNVSPEAGEQRGEYGLKGL